MTYFVCMLTKITNKKQGKNYFKEKFTEGNGKSKKL